MQKINAPSLVSVTYGMLTAGQQKEAVKQGFVRNAQSVKPTSVLSVPLGMLNKQQQAQLLQGATPTKARTGKTGKWRRRDRSGAIIGQGVTAQAGSATVQSEMKIADYSQRGMNLKLVYGNGAQVAKHLSTLPNREAVAMIAIDDARTYGNGKFPWAAALYIDSFVQSFENAKQALPTQFAQGIIETLNGKSVMKKVSYLNFLAKFGNGTCYVNASRTLKGTPATRRFLSALWASAFGKDGTVIGTSRTESTNAIVLLGDNGPRIGYAWVGENFSCVPSAFPEKETTHHTVGEDFFIELVPGTTSFKGVTSQQIWDAVHNGQAPEMLTVNIDKIDGKVVDLSLVATTPTHGFVAIATLEGGANGYLPLAVDLSGQKITFRPIPKLGVPSEVAKSLGGIISRFSSQGITMTSSKGEDIVKRLPANYQPAELRGMVTALYEPQQAAA